MYEVTKQELSRIAYVMMLVAEYMEPLIDTEDGENGWPVPNKEMRIASMVDEIHTDMENILKRKDDKVIIQRFTGPRFADWSTAPDWANWWAMDSNGDCMWYEENPIAEPSHGEWIVNSGATQLDTSAEPSWIKTLEKRPA